MLFEFEDKALIPLEPSINPTNICVNSYRRLTLIVKLCVR